MECRETYDLLPIRPTTSTGKLKLLPVKEKSACAQLTCENQQTLGMAWEHGSLGTKPSKNQEGRSGNCTGVEVYIAPGTQVDWLCESNTDSTTWACMAVSYAVPCVYLYTLKTIRILPVEWPVMHVHCALLHAKQRNAGRLNDNNVLIVHYWTVWKVWERA